MQILDRYLLRLFAERLAAALSILCALYLSIDLADKAGLLFARALSAGDIALVMACRLPAAFSHVLPFATVLAALLTISLLNRRGELGALSNAGVSGFRIGIPLLLGSLVAALASSVVGDQVVPRAEALVASLSGSSASSPVGKGHRSVSWQTTPTTIWRAGHSSSGGRLENVDLLQLDTSNRFVVHVRAETVRREEARWMAPAAQTWRLRPDGVPVLERGHNVAVPLPGVAGTGDSVSGALFGLTYRQLRDGLDRIQADTRRGFSLRMAMVLKWLLPAACVLLTWVGVPLALRGETTSDTSRALGLSLCLIAAFAVTLWLTGAIVALAPDMPPLVAICFPQAAWLLAGGGSFLLLDRGARLPRQG